MLQSYVLLCKLCYELAQNDSTTQVSDADQSAHEQQNDEHSVVEREALLLGECVAWGVCAVAGMLKFVRVEHTEIADIKLCIARALWRLSSMPQQSLGIETGEDGAESERKDDWALLPAVMDTLERVRFVWTTHASVAQCFDLLCRDLRGPSAQVAQALMAQVVGAYSVCLGSSETHLGVQRLREEAHAMGTVAVPRGGNKGKKKSASKRKKNRKA
jgi:hypothetical protein